MGPVNHDESSQLYVSTTIFSALAFMTSGYADIVPNSIASLAIVGLQFIFYIAVFIILIPLLPANKANSADAKSRAADLLVRPFLH